MSSSAIENINRFTETFFFPLKDYTATGGYYISDPITIYGFTPGANVEVSSIFGEVDAGSTSLSGSFSSSITVNASSGGSITVSVRYNASNVDPSIINGVSLNVAEQTGRWEFSIANSNTAIALNLLNFSFSPKLDVELGREITSDEVLVSGFIPNVLYVFTTSPLGGVNMGVSSIIGMFGNDMPFTPTDSSPVKFAVQISNSGSEGGTKVEIPITARAVINGKVLTQTTTFYCVTKATGTGLSNFFINSVSDVQPNTLVTSEVKEIAGIQSNKTYTISTSFPYGDVNIGLTNNLPSGSFAKSKSITTTSSNPIYIAAIVNSSSSYNTEFSIPLTLSDGTTVKTTNWLVKTKNQTSSTPGTGGTTPGISNYSSFPITNVIFASQSNVEPNTNIVSETIRVTGVPSNTDVKIVTDRGLVNVGTYQLGNTFLVDPVVQSSPDGSFVMAIQLPSSSAGMSSTMSITCSVGGNYYQSNWTIKSTAPVGEVVGSGNILLPDSTFPSFRATSFNFLSIGGVELNSDITSNTIQITNLPPNSLINISTNRGLVNVGLTQLGTTFTSNPSIITSGAGIILLAVKQPSAGYGQTASMTITLTVGGESYSTTWDVTSKSAPAEVMGPTSSTDFPIKFSVPQKLEGDYSVSLNFFSVTYGNGKFVALTKTNTGDIYYPLVSLSSDGVTWTIPEHTHPENLRKSLPWGEITFNKKLGKFIISGSLSNAREFYWCTSPDGLNWTPFERSANGNELDFDAVFNPVSGKYISFDRDENKNQLVAITTDFVTWTFKSIPELNYANKWLSDFGVSSSNKWVAAGAMSTGDLGEYASIISTSTDGETWTEPVFMFPDKAQAQLTKLWWLPSGKWWFRGYGGTNYLSSDAVTWTPNTDISTKWFSIIKSEIDSSYTIIIIGGSQLITKNTDFVTSTTKVIWGEPPQSQDQYGYRQVYAFDGNQRVVAINISEDNKIYTSYSMPTSSSQLTLVTTQSTTLVTTQPTALTTSQPTVLKTSQPTALVTTQVSTLTVAPPINLSPAPSSVVNTPILCSLSLAPFVGNELTVLKEQYAYSLGSNYKSLYSNAIGKYQFSIPILKEFGYLKSTATNLANANWIGNYGFRSRELFLDAPEHQELFFDKIMLKRYNELRAKGIDLTKFTTLPAGGMLISAARFGVDAMVSWVNQLPVTFVTA